MAQIKANPDEYLFRLREHLRKTPLSEAERKQLNQCVDLFETIYHDWKNIKQTMGEDNGE